MELVLSHWGNSLGLRLPKSIAKMLHLKGGSKVTVALKNGKLILSPLVETSTLESLAKSIDLEAMVGQVTSKNKHISLESEESPVGNEVW